MSYTLSWWEKIYYPCWRFVNKFNPRDRSNDVRHFIQRGRRGWADPDWWSVDYYLVTIIPPMLRKLSEGVSYPGVGEYDTPDKWSKACVEAADDIEAFYKHEELSFPDTKEEQDKYFNDKKEAIVRTQKGIRFVADNFFDLWD